MNNIDQLLEQMTDCKICGNTRRVPYIDPVFGEREQQCKCMAYKKNIARLKRSRIPKSYIGFEFSDYKCNTKEKDNWNKNKATVDRLIKTIGKHEIVVDDNYDIFIYGGAVCGKTMLASITLKQLILEHGYSGAYITAEELVILAIEKNRFGVEKDLKLDDLLEHDFLVIDGVDELTDLDNGRISGNVCFIIEAFFAQRKNTGKSFILTSKLSFKGLLARKRFIPRLACTTIRYRLYGNYMETKLGEIDARLDMEG